MMGPTEITSALLGLRDLLVKYEYFGQAARVEETILLADSAPEDFLRQASGGDIWGSAGSVFDIVLSSDTVIANPEEVLADERRRLDFLLQIAEGLVRQGDPMGDAENHAAMLRNLKALKFPD